MNQPGPVGERLMTIIKHYGLNKNTFSLKLGMVNNSLIVRIINDAWRGASLDLLQKVLIEFPEVNARWLVMGEGDMLDKPDFPDPKLHYIQYYKDQMQEPVDLFRLAGYEDCDFAFDVVGDSMTPRYQTGDVVVCKEVDIYGPLRIGEAYRFISKDIPFIRFIKNEIDAETLKLGAENQRHEDTTIRKTDISRLWLIKGSIRREAY